MRVSMLGWLTVSLGMTFVVFVDGARTWAQEAASSDEPRRPNILFAISDDQSWMHAGAYGDRGTRTPSFDRIAREGCLFQYAYAASPSCAPSRSAILTGRNIWELKEGGVLMGTLKSEFTPFSLLLQQAGYELGSTGKTWGPGRLEGFTTDDGRPLPARSSTTGTTTSIIGNVYGKHRAKPPYSGINPNDYARNFEDFLEARDKERPFFFWFGCSEPHQRYQKDAWKAAGKRLEDATLPGCLPDDPVTRGEILDYGLEIEHFDQHLGRMLESLEKRNLLEQTIVIVTSDHGNPLPRSKCNLYDSGTRVPLAIRLPAARNSGRECRGFFNLIDLAPTVLSAAGLEPTGEMSGTSWWGWLNETEPATAGAGPDYVVTAFERHIIARRNGLGYPMRAIRTERYAYIKNYEPTRWPAGDPDFLSSHQRFYGDCDQGASKQFLLENCQREDIYPYFILAFGRRPAEELYDMRNDPSQLRNLADDPHLQAVKQNLMKQMEDHLRSTNDPRMQGASPWDDYPFVDERIFGHPQWRLHGQAVPLHQAPKE